MTHWLLRHAQEKDAAVAKPHTDRIKILEIENEELRADNKRLRGSLKQIANYEICYETGAECGDWLREVARRALEDK